MKIILQPEWYVNNPPPPHTKKMWDWFWTRLFMLPRLPGWEEPQWIDTFKIRYNAALEHSPVHFYVSINGGQEMHMEWNRFSKGHARSRKTELERFLEFVHAELDGTIQDLY